VAIERDDGGDDRDVKCEVCKKNDATVHLKQAADGKVKECHLCEACAAEKGFDVAAPMALTDFLFGMEVQQDTPAAPGEPEVTCAACGMRTSDFRKRSRLGCPRCYETFSADLEPMLAGIQKGTWHTGKVPERQKLSAEIASTRKLLDEAVEIQNFEEAAKLRDLLRDLTKASTPKRVAEEKAD
jgi:protein arginine kinase activator